MTDTQCAALEERIATAVHDLADSEAMTQVNETVDRHGEHVMDVTRSVLATVQDIKAWKESVRHELDEWSAWKAGLDYESEDGIDDILATLQ